MGSTAGLHIDSIDIDNSDNIAGHDTPLVEMEAMLLFGLAFVLEVFVYFMSFEDNLVCFVFNGHLDLLSD